VHLETGNSF